MIGGGCGPAEAGHTNGAPQIPRLRFGMTKRKGQRFIKSGCRTETFFKSNLDGPFPLSNLCPSLDYCAFQKPGSFLTHSAGGLLMRGLISKRLVLVASTLAAVSSLIFCMPAAPTSAANLSESLRLLSV